VRIFLAVFPPPAAVDVAFRAIETLRRPGDGVSWVKRDNLHFTLRFLGELGADGLRRVSEAAREAAAERSAFGVKLGPPGAFPSAKRARVLWLGLSEGAEPFAQLAAALERSLARRGFAPEGRGFEPHLTLGRVRTPGRDWTSELIAAPSPDSDPAARFAVERLSVVRSTLSPGGSRYDLKSAAPLGAPSP
jgi:2'-5' RNA ligase